MAASGVVTKPKPPIASPARTSPITNPCRGPMRSITQPPSGVDAIPVKPLRARIRPAAVSDRPRMWLR